MKLPNAERAVVDMAKLREYVLSETHPVGHHKSKIMRAAFGFRPGHEETLAALLLSLARSEDATLGRKDEHGQRYLVDAVVEGPRGSGVLRSAWIVERGTDFPRLLSCYPRNRRHLRS